ncbi:MAG: lipid A export permease/ATP-binding protein MsbA [Burkholderiaceae bacterium]|nr:lipid A export permease/ATP-binding protein MsbA [Burkholderiaceae bacterium]
MQEIQTVTPSKTKSAFLKAAPNALKRLFGELSQYRSALLLIALCFVVVAITEVMLPALMKPLLDRGFSSQYPHYIWLAPVCIISLFLVRGIFTFTSNYLLSWISNQLLANLRQRMFDKLLTLPDRFFKTTPSSETLNRFVVDAQNALQSAAETFSTAVRDSLVIIGLITYLFWLNWQLTLIAIVIVPLAAWITRLFAKRLTTLARGTQQMNVELTKSVLEGNEGQRVVKLYEGYTYEKERFSAVNQRLRRLAMRNTIAFAATVPITQIIASAGLGIVIALALWQGQKGEFTSSYQSLTVGGFASFVTAMLQLLAPLKHLANLNAPLARMQAAAENVYQFLDQASEPDTGQQRLERARGHIEFKNVSLRFSDSATDTIGPISVIIQPGQTAAFIGRSGSGKTTLVSMLPRFIEPTGGAVLLDGEDIRTLTLESLRSQMAMVGQDVVLFDDTIAANVAYGALTPPSEEEIWQALEAANLKSFVQTLPNNLYTHIGEGGSRLSGGQRQRLAIARAFIKNAPILILDEATSALDNESERQVQESIEQLMKNRTTLVIAHRLSTIQNSDVILVLDKGQIVEQGNHAALLNQNGLYAALYRLQFGQAVMASHPAIKLD